MTERDLLIKHESEKQMAFDNRCCDDFPLLFKNCFENSTPSGWQEDVYETLKELNKFEPEGVHVAQIKSKFGLLCLYLDCEEAKDIAGAESQEYCYSLIETLYEKVRRKCEFTGFPSRLVRIGSWVWNVTESVENVLKER